MTLKKLFFLLYVALATSVILGTSLVWLLAGQWWKKAALTDEFYAESRIDLNIDLRLRRSLRTYQAGVGRGQQVRRDSVAMSNKQSNIILSGGTGPSGTNTSSRNPDRRGREIINYRDTTKSSNSGSMAPADSCRWVNRTEANKPRYFLTAVVLLRIYKDDKAKLTTRELKQWLQYMKYIGVEHVYLYDAFYNEEEAQAKYLDVYLRENYVTYIDWHMHNPYTISGTQVTAYQHCIDNFGSESTWQTAIDIDEYPFSPVDTEPYFLARFVNKHSAKHPNVAEICMENFLFLGKPLRRELLVERLWRRDKQRSNKLVKPIYKPANVSASVHHNNILSGSSVHADEKELRMNHYWGARLQNWGEDTPEILTQTIEDRGMETVIRAFRECELFIRPYL